MDAATLALFATIVISLAAALLFAVFDSYGDRTAIMRAEAVLRTHLSEQEFTQLERSGELQVPSPTSAGRVYHVRANSSRVVVRKNGCTELELCVRPRDLLPGREHVLAHKLMIEAAEDEYMRQANVVWRAGQITTVGDRWWWD